jgi:hypothetical protein
MINKNDLRMRDVEQEFKKVCSCGSGVEFYARNRKQRFLNPYHKNYYHYSIKKEGMKNQLELEKGNYMNYLVLRDLFTEGYREISPDALQLRKFNPLFPGTPCLVSGAKALVYNDLALVTQGGFGKIIKIGSWHTLNK